MFEIYLIAGARPNYVKIAALVKAFQKMQSRRTKKTFSFKLINTGQHYDYQMSKSFFKDLGIPKPYKDLEVGSSTHGVQTARIMDRFEKLVFEKRPDLVVVVGDVNSTMACTLVATKVGIPVAHVEAGLRSFDRDMPEEINRLVTDAISDLLFTTSKDADGHLKREGVSAHKIFRVGNVMVDTLLTNLPKAKKSEVKKKLGIKGPYALLTLHRPSNVDSEKDFKGIVDALETIQKRISIIFPVHPRTAARLKQGSLGKRLAELPQLNMVSPVGYLDFIHLLNGAKLVLTDSGGIQEESTILRVPCLTLRDNTERPVTISQGSNILVGRKRAAIIRHAFAVLDAKKKTCHKCPPQWDGKAANRIVTILAKKFKF